MGAEEVAFHAAAGAAAEGALAVQEAGLEAPGAVSEVAVGGRREVVEAVSREVAGEVAAAGKNVALSRQGLSASIRDPERALDAPLWIFVPYRKGPVRGVSGASPSGLESCWELDWRHGVIGTALGLLLCLFQVEFGPGWLGHICGRGRSGSYCRRASYAALPSCCQRARLTACKHRVHRHRA